ncbi:putative uncharacterized protein [Parachlamydia acanthamoebae UV-7]|uniref:Sel1 repeat family protein n=1 Tax=Parachlamydia acanthamoebae (strain UV7) TaxID=765952 RepID=F8KZM6_PARAV|nr:tetratricopeptide repeat protein [Parachlamydia acanthamoebae]CCB86370.1 putative uncharacterized protein [Parachlamydia acanthamoebae UV-7]
MNSLFFQGYVEKDRLILPNDNHGIRIEGRIVGCIKDLFAYFGMGKGTIAIQGTNHKIWRLNKQSAINWLHTIGDKTDLVGLDQKNNQIISDKVTYLYVKKRAERSATSCFYLGYLYELGIGVEQSYEEAFLNYKKALQHQSHHPYYLLAHLKMGDFLAKGIGTLVDKDQALSHYDQAFGGMNCLVIGIDLKRRKIYDKNFDLHVFLADMYEEGKGVKKSPEEATMHYQKAADQGNAYAQGALALKYLNGSGVTASVSKAKKLAHQSAKKRHPFGQYVLALIYERKGETLLAKKWIEKSASQGFALAQQHLARLCAANGSNEQSLELYKKAALQGLSESQFQVGRMLQEEDVQRYEISNEDVVSWYKKSAEQDNVEAQIALGMLYYAEQEENASLEQTLYWLKRASALNPERVKLKLDQMRNDLEIDANSGNIQAQLNLGELHRSTDETFNWYERAAEQGSAEAEYRLANLYANESEANALKYYRRAADKGHPLAQYQLGIWYFDGRNPMENLKGAVKLLKQSAQQNCTKARDFLFKRQIDDNVQLKSLKHDFLVKIDGSSLSKSISFMELFETVEYKRSIFKNSPRSLELLEKDIEDLTTSLNAHLKVHLDWSKELLEKADERLQFSNNA